MIKSNEWQDFGDGGLIWKQLSLHNLLTLRAEISEMPNIKEVPIKLSVTVHLYWIQISGGEIAHTWSTSADLILVMHLYSNFKRSPL